MLTTTEENYLKAIYHLSEDGVRPVSTTELAQRMNTSPASITDMVKRLSSKNLLHYERYRGVMMTGQGRSVALGIIRRHRLWETFLVRTLGFRWDEVHEVAEQLEHVQSGLLVDKLDEFLGRPKADPHGHVIPDHTGQVAAASQTMLTDALVGTSVKVESIADADPALLQYLSRVGLFPGTVVFIIDRRSFDGSMEIRTDSSAPFSISRDAGAQLLVS